MIKYEQKKLQDQQAHQAAKDEENNQLQQSKEELNNKIETMISNTEIPINNLQDSLNDMKYDSTIQSINENIEDFSQFVDAIKERIEAVEEKLEETEMSSASGSEDEDAIKKNDELIAKIPELEEKLQYHSIGISTAANNINNLRDCIKTLTDDVEKHDEKFETYGRSLNKVNRVVRRMLTASGDDYIFIYYDDHGGFGVLGTPNGYDEILVDKLAESFDKASETKLYKQCLFMIEACYSGSIGENITAPNLAIITAANDIEESFAAIYDEAFGQFISNEFTNSFISYIDEQPEATIGELFQYLKENTEHSNACYFGDESMKSLSLSTFIGMPNKILTNPVHINTDLKVATSREVTEMTLKFLSQHSSPSIRARAKLQMLHFKALKEKLETVLDMIVKYVDPKNYEKIKNDHSSKISKTYLEVFTFFREKFGEINPDDFGMLNVLVSLAATHSKEEIIEAISAVVF